MNKRVCDLEIIDNRRLNDGYFILDLKTNSDLSAIQPGQFVQVRVDNSPETFLRRPISVYDIDSEKGVLSLLIKIVGEGTLCLSGMAAGDMLNVIYPLGNWFSDPGKNDSVLLVGGGVGVAPLYLKGRKLKAAGINFRFLLGYRSNNSIIEYERFNSLAEVLITTEDGSQGHKGLVTGHPVLGSATFNRIYCCGPEPMMKGVAHLARQQGIHCEVSLENLMACGFGVCLCCTVETDEGNLCSCTEGPVFNINKLKWQI